MVSDLLHVFALVATIACAVLVLRLRDLLSCAIALGGCGFFVAWVYFALKAPDLGVVQLLVEVIKMCILVLVVAKTHRVAFSVESMRIRLTVAAGLALVLFCFVLFIAPQMSPYGAEPPDLARRYAQSGADETGSSNLVTSILLGFRAYDTVGEICVLLISIVGISIVLRRKGVI
jgi:multisubunit Na+/H+ antiporter MnhB subunit